MISNVTDTTPTALATPAQNPNVTTLNTCFGQLLVENLGSDSPTVVGFTPPDVQIQNEGGSASTQAASVPAAADTANTASAAANTAANSAASTAANSIGTMDPKSVPTAQSMFGASPWVSDAGGNGPTGAFNLNPMYFATQQTAQQVAAMVGGTVVSVDTFAQTPGNHFTQNEPNEMVQLPDGAMINAGLVAGFFTHGYQASMVQQMIQNEVTNVEAETKGVATT